MPFAQKVSLVAIRLEDGRPEHQIIIQAHISIELEHIVLDAKINGVSTCGDNVEVQTKCTVQ